MPLPPVPTFSPQAEPGAIVRLPHARFTVLTDRLLRLEYSPEDVFEDRPSQTFWHRRQRVPSFSQRVTDSEVEIETEHLLLEYRVSRRGFQRSTLSITLKASGATWRYGQKDRRNLGGTARTLDAVAGRTRLEPGLVSRSGWVLVDDSKTLVFDEQGWLTPRSGEGRDLYFFGYGSDYAGCLADFTKLAGPVPMVPRFVLGNWWSRYWAYSQSELQALVEDFRAHAVPLSVCIVDMDWHITRTGNESNGWTGYTWNRDLFPDPPGFLRWLHDQGLRTALNLHPARGVFPHEERYPEMARWMGLDPAGRQPVPFEAADPHFMEGYFDILHHPLEAMGVDFWWMDWQQGRRSKLAGLDPLWWLNHLHFQDLGRNGRLRPFIFSRWGGLGNHRTPIGFSGDTIILWASLAFQPRFTSTAANLAYGWWSHDIGGHMFMDGTPELYLRWVQFGAFSPVLRLHSTNKPALERRPWGKPEPIFRAAREAMQLRHSLIPYLYSMAWRFHRTGLAPLLPMYYGSDAPAAYTCPDQYWFGTELVAAPVVRPVRRSSGRARSRVWLPEGGWFHFFTGETLRAGWQAVHSALEDIPVFARAGAIVPLGPKVGWGGIENPPELHLHVFPGASNRFELYEDDGETVDYQKGKYALTPFTLVQGQDELVFTIGTVQGERDLVPARRTYRVHLRGVGSGVSCPHPAVYDPSTRSLDLEAVVLTPGDSFRVRFRL